MWAGVGGRKLGVQGRAQDPTSSSFRAGGRGPEHAGGSRGRGPELTTGARLGRGAWGTREGELVPISQGRGQRWSWVGEDPKGHGLGATSSFPQCRVMSLSNPPYSIPAEGRQASATGAVGERLRDESPCPLPPFLPQLGRGKTKMSQRKQLLSLVAPPKPHP